VRLTLCCNFCQYISFPLSRDSETAADSLWRPDSMLWPHVEQTIRVTGLEIGERRWSVMLGSDILCSVPKILNLISEGTSGPLFFILLLVPV
jgi:hypothetical protein